MISFNQDEINLLLNPISDLLFKTYEEESSYVYIKNLMEDREIKTFTDREKEIFKAFFKLVVEKYSMAKDKADVHVIFYGHYFRCNMMHTISGDEIACRHMPFEFITLEQTGLHQSIQKEVLHSRLKKGGLIFVCGAPGNGKSTTTAAIIKERLKEFGGVCISIEDPVEIPMHGKHGNGRCIQVPVTTNFSDAVRNSMRSYPTGQSNMLFLGEIRDSETAQEAIRSAIDGRLVITTFHTESINMAFERLVALSKEKLGEDDAYSLIAEAFRFGIHQRLVKTNEKIMLRTSVLADTLEVYTNIRNKRISHLQNEKERQFILLKNNEELTYRSR